MADELISSLYPPPPPYYKFFTEENVDKFQKWCETHNVEEELPPGELRFQVPPKVPSGEQYRGYGSLWALENKLPSLKASGWRQLYNDDDETITSTQKIDELHKLLDSLLLNFLELVGSVSVEPAKFYVKIEDLKLILINMNHLLNTYRPHQTRESLIMLLKTQIEAKRAEIQAIDNTAEEVKARILSLVQNESFTDLLQDEPVNDSEQESSNADREAKLEALKTLMNKT
ncbi:putative mediator of RNA polymerase II transcription subunit [Clavispora lusitaniae]|uniref:Mediator of RNA polymerase II transcription subunit n=1 Tax=Clavispora lusitaniae TaxID=36911 RepID=A0ACD0WPR4_CLALS|nr:putative mediator of RNA polymerase II transcription subunit [Clavispora lusitaniae]QFZ35048.1 putative mediator of RNA polymerase II transcription subunit [Clavispora lusitaniae]QFZ40733.1 putative mediator of RNA polymerase II transcription subunit [Clavispora lusitaniae]QFZ46413.1 putative mediator of RNA polymerase II transcription subunit [Clavispora lusitaniae]QFZ52075.1 putative mediator of RNA polymerase II transcription subunit [Clavispora lusitaniae]